MELHQRWPKELLIHYWRLEDNFQTFIFDYVEKHAKKDEDNLLNFINGVIGLSEIQGIIFSNSEFLFLAAQCYLLLGKYDNVYEICAKDEFHPGLINTKAQSLISQRKFDEVSDIITKAEEYSKLDPVNALHAKANRVMYLYYSQQFDNIQPQLELLTAKYEKLCEEYSSDDNLLLSFAEIFALGKSVVININRREGKLEEGETVGRELISLVRKSNNRYLLNRLLNNTALCSIEGGNLKEGLSYLEEAFQFSSILANKLRIAVQANNIGFIYRNMGNLEMAMKYFYIALDNATAADVDPHYIIVATETNIAHLHLDFGNPKLALSDSEAAIKSLKSSNVTVPPNIKIALDLCRADIFESLDRFNEANETLDLALAEIGEANLKSDIPKVYLRKARLAARQSNLGEAKRLLENALELALENKLFEIIVNTKLQLAEIDLLNYRMTNEKQLISTALTKIDDTKQLCVEQDYKLVLIDVYILQGLLLSMINKSKEGKNVLNEAIDLAHQLNLQDKEKEARKQLAEITKEKKNLLVRIFTRINQSIRSTLAFESVSKPKKIETEIKAVYIISKKSGLPLYEHNFSEESTIDTKLLSGLLSAIRTMGQAVLDAEEGGLKLIDHGNVSIMLETDDNCFFALVVLKETYLLREMFREFTKKIYDEGFFKDIDHSIIQINELRNYEITKVVDQYLKK
ncbi:MAG: tetratricopeptide repeat protein [Asgard group archaeon]|nr:tetratricopeptide repeat protein [Asgard group archaeon]